MRPTPSLINSGKGDDEVGSSAHPSDWQRKASQAQAWECSVVFAMLVVAPVQVRASLLPKNYQTADGDVARRWATGHGRGGMLRAGRVRVFGSYASTRGLSLDLPRVT